VSEVISLRKEAISSETAGGAGDCCEARSSPISVVFAGLVSERVREGSEAFSVRFGRERDVANGNLAGGPSLLRWLVVDSRIGGNLGASGHLSPGRDETQNYDVYFQQDGVLTHRAPATMQFL